MAGGTAKSVPSDEWAKHMPIIRQLYLDEGMTLKEVMTVMASEFGFIASYGDYLRRENSGSEADCFQSQNVQDTLKGIQFPEECSLHRIGRPRIPTHTLIQASTGSYYIIQWPDCYN